MEIKSMFKALTQGKTMDERYDELAIIAVREARDGLYAVYFLDDAGRECCAVRGDVPAHILDKYKDDSYIFGMYTTAEIIGFS